MGAISGLPSPDDGGGPRRDRARVRQGYGDVQVHARLSGWAGAVLHDSRAGQTRLRARAVGRDQGGSLGQADRAGRHDYASSRGRQVPSSVVRPPASRWIRARTEGGEEGARPALDSQSRRTDRSGLSDEPEGAESSIAQGAVIGPSPSSSP